MLFVHLCDSLCSRIGVCDCHPVGDICMPPEVTSSVAGLCPLTSASWGSNLVLRGDPRLCSGLLCLKPVIPASELLWLLPASNL